MLYCDTCERVAIVLVMSLLALGGWLLLAGCSPEPFPLLVNEQARAAPEYYEVEPNDDGSLANLVDIDAGVWLVGAVAGGDDPDYDVYDLGPAGAGARVRAALDANDEDIQIGLFNDRFELLGLADGSSQTAGASQILTALREPVPRVLVVAASRSTAAADRPYSILVSIAPGDGVPAGKPQVVVLHFLGAGEVVIGRQPPVDVPPFDIASVDPRLAGQTQAVIGRIMEKVREDYDGLAVSFHLADDSDTPSGDRTVIYFGATSDRYLGLAEDVDPYNRDATESAIIYTDNFSLFDVFSPGVEEIAQVLANTTSHELGHLLGLRHTADIRDVMDTTASARQMLSDQTFGVAELHPSVMSIGVQNDPSMLAEAVGGNLTSPRVEDRADLRTKAAVPLADDDFHIPREILAANSHDGDEASAGREVAEAGN